jgi:hypothetical protein
MGFFATGHPEITKVTDGFLTGAQLGTGGVVGLVGGKALK